MIKQGARSTVTLTKYDGVDCIHKIYDDRKSRKEIKLKNEQMFYQRYTDVDVIPHFFATDGISAIWIEYRPGRRHIDLINEGLVTTANKKVSVDYGKKVATFLEYDRANPLPYQFDLTSYITFHTDLLESVKDLNPQHHDVYKKHFEKPIKRLSEFDDAQWLAAMVSKTDFSSANLFILDDAVSCIFDFDTAYVGNRALFLGDIINSCVHPNLPDLHDWNLVRQSLTEAYGSMPSKEVLCGATLLGLLSTTLDRLTRVSDSVIPWPGGEQFEAMALDRIRVTGMA